MSDADEGILDELIIESTEHLEAIEPNLLILEKEGNRASADIINEIFRAMHSIKGGFGFFGMRNISNLSHAMESVLMQARDGQMEITPAITDALLAGIDKLRWLLKKARESESLSIEDEYLPLQKILANPGNGESIEAVNPPAKSHAPDDLSRFGLSWEKIQQQISPGEDIYLISLNLPQHLSAKHLSATDFFELLDATGVFLHSDPPRQDCETLDLQTTGNLSVSILQSTIMEPSLLAMTLGITADMLAVVGPEHFTSPSSGPAVKPPPAATSHTPRPAADRTTATGSNQGDRAETIRVRVDLLNSLMTLAGEMVLGRNQLQRIFDSKIHRLLTGADIVGHYSACMHQARENILTFLKEGSAPNTADDVLEKMIEEEFSLLEREFSRTLDVNLQDLPGVAAIIQNMNYVTSELQNGIMNTRLQPVSAVFSKFPRIIRDMAKKLGKSIELTIAGEEVELDKSIIEMLGDPLTHLIRNCADHAIEFPEIREKAGKPQTGSVDLRAYHEGGQVNIDIIDDGAGIDADSIRQKAVDKGFMTAEETARLSDRDALRLIFTPGFSMAREITDISGRGVGMDVVKTNIEKLGGTVSVDSTPGKGSRVNLKLPLTLAIIPSLIIQTEKRIFAVPQTSLDELVRVRIQESHRIKKIQGKSVLELRGCLVPLVRLNEVLDLTPTYSTPDNQLRADRRRNIADRRQPDEAFPELAESAACMPSPGAKNEPGAREQRRPDADRRQSWRNSLNILIMKSGPNRYGLIVDRLLNNEEIVVKPLPSYLNGCKLYAGATIMGDGRVAMILDSTGISDKAGLQFSLLEEKNSALQQNFDKQALAEAQTLLLFSNGTSEKFAVNLALVARVEKIDCGRIEIVGDRQYLKYDDSTLRLLKLHDYLPISQPESPTAEKVFVIVPKLVSNPMGIIVSAIHDIIETTAGIDRNSFNANGIHGTLLHNRQLIILVNIYNLLEAANPEPRKESKSLQKISGKKVLLAEDTAFFQAVEREYLEELGCRVDVVSNGAEAWQKLAANSYDILVTDIVMPVMDGLELIKRVKQSGNFPHLPVIALTSLVNAGDRQRILDSGVDAYETKLDKDKLRSVLFSLLT